MFIAIPDLVGAGGGGSGPSLRPEARVVRVRSGDLKLTEHLSNELEEVRNKFESMHEALEKAVIERDSYKKKFIILNTKVLD